MRSAACILLLLVTGLAPVAADERAPQPPPKLLLDDAVARVLAAWEGDDLPALRALAAHGQPDPWLVADALCLAEAHAAAAAFAAAVPVRPATARLVAYVDGQRTRTASDPAQAVATAMNAALARGDFAAALEAGDELEGALDTVLRVRIAYGQGLALTQADRPEAGFDRWLEAADAARALGWFEKAIQTCYDAYGSAWRRSDWPRALLSQERALALYEDLGDEAGMAGALANIGSVHEKLSRYAEALEAHHKALALWQKLGRPDGIAGTYGNIGVVHMRRGEYAEALGAQQEALALFRALKDRAGMARTTTNIAIVQELRGDLLEAVASLEEALTTQRELQDASGVAQTLGNLGNVLAELGDYPRALAAQEEALGLKRRLQDRAGEALTLGNLASVYTALSDYPKALGMQREALGVKMALRDEAGGAATLASMGVIHVEIGEFPQALVLFGEALAIMRRVQDRAGEARTLQALGVAYFVLGDDARAVKYYGQALALNEALENRVGAAWCQLALGAAQERGGQLEAARRTQEQTLERMRALSLPAGVSRALHSLGRIHEGLGAFPEALARYQESLDSAQTLEDPGDVARALEDVGRALGRLGRPQEGLPYLDRAIREARATRSAVLLVRALATKARLRLEAGDAGRALAEAQTALGYLEDLLGGLGEEEGASARARHAELFAVGTLAAARQGAKGEALELLESGRAGALLESLRSSRWLRYGDLPDELRQALAAAQAEESRARHAYTRARETQDMPLRRERLQDLDRALDGRREVEARIQREAKRQAQLFYPRAATLEQIQARLPADTALVIYAFCLDEALAMVVEHDGARVAPLGPAERLREACRALDLEDPEARAEPALDRLRGLVVAPLKLEEHAHHVLVSPDDLLGYVPFGALFLDRDVTLTPSGTTHLHLLDQPRDMGRGVLALGDPAYDVQADPGPARIYRGDRKLLPLGATRKEVEAIGDVKLLGAEASVASLRREIPKRPRWRAVHFACHGLIDAERPVLSSLALAQGGAGDEDGFLTASEVLRMRIPADLVVLSACETGKGRIVRAEGIVGLMRTFMYAGAPRVICSLWKVEDEATRALMEKFYALWNPRPESQDGQRAEGSGEGGMPAAQALREAQAWLREQPLWRHPHYWAPWVLWGLPD